MSEYTVKAMFESKEDMDKALAIAEKCYGYNYADIVSYSPSDYELIVVFSCDEEDADRAATKIGGEVIDEHNRAYQDMVDSAGDAEFQRLREERRSK